MSRHIAINGTVGQEKALLAKLSMTLDELVERVETAIDMWPDNLRIVLLLRDKASGVQDIYRQRYGKECDYKHSSASEGSKLFCPWPMHHLRCWPMKSAMPLLSGSVRREIFR